MVLSMVSTKKKQEMYLSAPNQHIWLIFEELCDTEDWNNDTENTALSLQDA